MAKRIGFAALIIAPGAFAGLATWLLLDAWAQMSLVMLDAYASR